MNLFDVLDPQTVQAAKQGSVRQYDPWTDSSQRLQQAADAQWGRQLQRSVMPEVRQIGDFLAAQNPAINEAIGMAGAIDIWGHPAQYTHRLLPHIKEMLRGYKPVIDPFGGAGARLRQAIPDAIPSDLQLEYIRRGLADTPGMGLVANALHLPYKTGSVPAAVASPTYGNMLARKGRFGRPGGKTPWAYEDTLSAPMHPDNSGRMWWGPKYRDLHERAWPELFRVLQPQGRFVLNIKDFIKGGKQIPVSEWQREAAERAGFRYLDKIEVPVPGHKSQFTAGEGKVIPYENLYLLEKPK